MNVARRAGDPRPTVIVIGAINVDLVVSGAALPRPGETVVGGSFSRHHGGKGGNQAVAVARALGTEGRVLMVAAVGDDDLGRGALAALEDDKVDVRHVGIRAHAPTGVALIAVDPAGENQISVAPGANGTLDPGSVEPAFAEVAADAPCVVLASLEVPLDAVRTCADLGHRRGIPFVLNPAPATASARDLAKRSTVVTPNRGERDLIGELPASVFVVETNGPDGATIDTPGMRTTVPAPAVTAVDATGAGDCFNGVLAVGLLEGLELVEAVGRAVAAAALSVTSPGAREGMPMRDRIDEFVGSR